MKVFLGGTCNDSAWRQIVINGIKMDYFNPVVDDWTPKCQEEEILQRNLCDFVLYVITPKMTGVYSIAEAIDDSNKRPKSTIFAYLIFDEGQRFDEGQQRSLRAVGNLIQQNGGIFCEGLYQCIEFLNHQCHKNE